MGTLMPPKVPQLYSSEKIQDGRYCCNLQLLSQVIQTPLPLIPRPDVPRAFSLIYLGTILLRCRVFNIVAREDTG